jgi:iron(III) transport system substrate-binding protein
MKISFPIWRVLGCLVVLTTVSGCPRVEPRVVLYCAQDQDFANSLLADFTKLSGLPVHTKFDTEANKSVSLYVELIQEQKRPRCDVFWNNEVLSTIRLQRQGLLEPNTSRSADSFPLSSMARDRTWQAFASRARVLIVNTRLVQQADRPQSLLDLTRPAWKGKVVMAQPQFGTSATQAACLFEVLGKEEAKQFYRGLKANEVQIAPGNKQVAEWVGQGRTPRGQPAAVGITDTDDAMAEIKSGHEVAIIYPDRVAQPKSRMGALFIPNTLAILKNCPNMSGARNLVEFLLMPEQETRLAEGDSHQIPMNPRVQAHLPPQIETPKTVHAMEVDFEKAADLWDEVQEFLIREFARP